MYLSPRSMEKSFHEHRKEKHTQVGCASNLGFDLITLCMLSSRDRGMCQGGAISPLVCLGKRKWRSAWCPCLWAESMLPALSTSIKDPSLNQCLLRFACKELLQVCRVSFFRQNIQFHLPFNCLLASDDCCRKSAFGL